MAGTQVQPPEGFVMCGPKTRARPRTGSGLSHPLQDQAAAQADTDSSVTRLPIGRETSALQYRLLVAAGSILLAPSVRKWRRQLQVGGEVGGYLGSLGS